MVEVYFNLDLTSNKMQNINVSQYDNNSRKIKIAVFNNGDRFIIPEGYMARIKMRKPDDTYILNDCTIEDNYVCFVIDEQETAIDGKSIAELLFTDRTDVILYSTTFGLLIKKSVYPSEDVISSSEYGSLENTLIRADYDIERMEELMVDNNLVHLEDVVPSVTRDNFNGVVGTDENGKVGMDSLYHGTANGLADLDEDGRIPSTQLPSYVDDVINGYAGTMTETAAGTYSTNKFYEDSEKTIELTPETGKIYLDITSNISFRWSGVVYVSIGTNLTLGETSSTAFAGNRGKNLEVETNEIKSKMLNKNTLFGTCNTAINISDKIVNCSDFILHNGAIILVKFIYGINSAFTLNVNNTGSKTVVYSKNTPVTNDELWHISANDTVMFVYNGANWQIYQNDNALNYLDENIKDLENEIEGKLLPSGGTTAQALVKKSDSDYDTEWKDIAILDDSTTTSSNTWSANKISNIVEQLKDITSDEWINSKTYYVGDYCIFNNILWKCLVQHSGQEPSEGAYWTKVNVGEELKAIRYENIGNVKTVQIGTFNTTSQLQYFGFGNYTFENGWVPLFATVQGSVCIYPNSYQHDNAILKDVYIMDARVGGANADGTWFQNQLRVYRSAAGFYGGAPVYMTFLKVR